MMDESLTPEEQESVRQFLKLVNEIRHQHDAHELHYNTALKFMMARKFEVMRAKALYESHEVTRFREKLSFLDPNEGSLKEELATGKFTVLSTRDSNESTIVMFSVGKHSPPETAHSVTLQGMVYQLDVALEDIKTQRAGIVFIYNMTGSKYSNFDYELSQKILSLLKGAYPARLKKVLIVMAPLWFKAPFKILRLFIREKLRERVYMVNVSQLPNHIPLDSLPVELGGLYKHDHPKWLQHCETVSQDNKTKGLEGGLCDLAFSKKLLAGALINASDLSLSGRASDEESSTSSMSNHEVTGCAGGITESGTLSKKLGSGKPKPDKIIMPNNLPFEPVNGTANSSPNLPIPTDDVILHLDTDEGLTMEEFIQYMKAKGRKGLFDEYNMIKNKLCEGTFDHSRMRDNQGKNRYTDVLCFDHSRVRVNQVDDTDYINANFVDGYMQKNAFISTQGPLPRTYTDFWTMMWDEKVVVIVMTTRTVERSRPKCGQYWPLDEQTDCEYGPFVVTNEKVETFTDYIISRLIINDTRSKNTRSITHMIFNSWPDYGVPPSAFAMIEFREKVREEQKCQTEKLGADWIGHDLGPPIVVHCSAGIGRTGTFITLDISLRRLEDTGKICVNKTVEKIRTQRAYSIQMPDQYVFCYLAILEYALTRRFLGEDVDLSGFDDDESELEE